jgi:hypothetical protein
MLKFGAWPVLQRLGGGVGWSTWTSEGVAAAVGRSDTRLASVGARA